MLAKLRPSLVLARPVVLGDQHLVIRHRPSAASSSHWPTSGEVNVEGRIVKKAAQPAFPEAVPLNQ